MAEVRKRITHYRLIHFNSQTDIDLYDEKLLIGRLKFYLNTSSIYNSSGTVGDRPYPNIIMDMRQLSAVYKTLQSEAPLWLFFDMDRLRDNAGIETTREPVGEEGQ